jgi:uncharacterized protein YceH (UPF0502 family)
MHRFESGEELERTLDELIERELVAALPRQPGERGQRYLHRLSEPEAEEAAAPRPPAAPAPPAAPDEAVVAPQAPPPTDGGVADRLERLEDEVAALREQLAALRAELGE